MISVQDFLYFVDEALNGMVAILEELGDDLANRRPDVDRTNTPYVILTHCLGVIDYWGGHVVAGREVQRDRDAEFVASGPVAELVDRTRRTRLQLDRDLAHLDPFSPPRNPPRPIDASLPFHRTQGGVLLHVYEELAQHRGQMEGCRDVLHASWARLVAQVS
jgi:hypothetical protein